MSSHLVLKTVWFPISWLLQKPADLDLHCLQEKPADQDPYCLQELINIWFHTVFEQVENFTISTPLPVLVYIFNVFISF